MRRPRVRCVAPAAPPPARRSSRWPRCAGGASRCCRDRSGPDHPGAASIRAPSCIPLTGGRRPASADSSCETGPRPSRWRHALGDITPIAALAFQSGGAAFALAGSPIARDALVSKAGLAFAVAPNASLGISWTNQFADQSYDNTRKGNFARNF